MKQLITEHLAIWTTAPKGIKKLRELILELAVRGLLVPQEVNDEPASELLKKIAAEKARLVSEGIIKKQNLLLRTNEDEKPFDLPNNWEWVVIDDIFQFINGKAHEQFVSNDGEFILVNSRFVSTSGKTKKYSKELLSPLYNNDIAIVMSDVPNGRALGRAFLVDEDNKYTLNQRIGGLKAFSNLSHKYLLTVIDRNKYFLSFDDGKKQANLKKEQITSCPIPLPPLAEQQRIVAKVDELMQLCDRLEEKQSGSEAMHRQLVSCLLTTLTEATDAQAFQAAWSRIAANFDCLFTTEHSIEQLKQTILQLAVMGKLVPQNPNDEPASELLNKITTEKARLITEGKIKKQNPLPKISEQEKPFALPDNWEWERLGSSLDITGGVTLGRKLTGTDLIELPYLRVANVQRGYLNLDSIKTLEIRQSELSRYQLLKDDLLVTEGGDWDKVGRTAIWNAEIEFCLHQNHIFRMRNLIKDLSCTWIEMYMNSIAKAYFQAASKQTTNLASINMTQLKNCLLAIPPLAEQHRIVAKVDELLTLCDQLKTKLATAQTLQQQLAETLVQQAVA